MPAWKEWEREKGGMLGEVFCYFYRFYGFVCGWSAREVIGRRGRTEVTRKRVDEEW
jgi:hypothetical protein